MLIDDIKAACALKEQTVSGDPNPEFDLTAFRELEIPALCVNLPPTPSFAVVAEDGSVALVEYGRITTEFDGRRVEAEDVLLHAAAQASAVDFSAQRREGGRLVPVIGSILQDFCLLDGSAGARVRLGLPSCAKPFELASAARQAGGCAAPINAQLAIFGDALEDPLFVPLDSATWSAEAQLELDAVLVDVLVSDPDYHGGPVQLWGATDEQSARLDGPVYLLQIERALRLLEVLVDLSVRFTGVSWEYNDGIGARRSGFDKAGPIIFDGEIDPPSAHERLAARQRLTDQLLSAGKTEAEVRALLAI